MDSKLLRLLLIGGLALGLNACDDDSNSEPEECVTRCEANFSLQCQPGGSVIAVDCSKAGGCNAETGLCAGTPQQTAVCLDGATKCESNATWNCLNGQWALGATCPNGCNGNACAEAPTQGDCFAGSKKCENNVAYVCGSTTWVKAMDCPNGCDATTKACKTGLACSDGALQCNGAYVQACSNGQWVTAPTACANGCENGKCKSNSEPGPVDELDDCDYYNCSDEYLSECGGEGDMALCDTEYLYCVNRMASLDGECKDGETAYEVPLEDGSKQQYCLLVGATEACLEGGGGEGCEYESQCTGNVLNTCYDLSWIGWGIFKDDYDCAEVDKVCAVIGGEADCHDTCTSAGDMGSSCSVDEDYGNEVSVAKSCVQGDDGNLYVAEVKTSCAAACTDGKCVVLDPNEGKECDPKTDASYCNGNILVECDSWDEAWAAKDCVYSNNDKYTCLPGLDDPFECAIPCTAADEGKILSECEYSDYYSAYVQMNYVCTKITDGVYSYQWKNGKYCGDKCDDKGELCVKVLDNEGESCDAKTFAESCKGDIISYCGDDGTVTAFNCGLNSANCHVFTESGKADCATEKNVCTETGATSSICTDSLFYSYETLISCSAADNGKSYWMATGENECSGYCDSNGVACEGGSSSASSCDYYDCSDKYGSNGSADTKCDEEPNALCDGQYFYCVARAAESDSACASGEKAYSAEAQDGSTKTYCLNVGDDETCLGGSSSGSGEVVVCDDTCKVTGGVLCSDYCKNEKGSDVCYMDDEYVYCSDPNA
ncbi:MAG: hypothetical protein IJU23_00275 [Proteobacteria bacterium]|nr:hypothetical protein [Pseudomonadota bacterium]